MTPAVRLLAVTTLRKALTSLAIVAAAAVLMGFSATAAFTDTHDYFPQSVTADR